MRKKVSKCVNCNICLSPDETRKQNPNLHVCNPSCLDEDSNVLH
jgi:hypothetical protein